MITIPGFQRRRDLVSIPVVHLRYVTNIYRTTTQFRSIKLLSLLRTHLLCAAKLQEATFEAASECKKLVPIPAHDMWPPNGFWGYDSSMIT